MQGKDSAPGAEEREQPAAGGAPRAERGGL